MSRGKYSLVHVGNGPFIYNADKMIPPDYDGVGQYDERIHFPNYDADGYDMYGYSAFLADGTFVGIGQGVDRAGYTEDDYLSYLDMSDEEREEYCGD